jgi:hypothetical protein
LRVRNLDDSRWLSLGEAAKGFLAGMLVGLPDLVAFVRQGPAVTDFYLNS